MLRITLACAGGMSSSLLIKRMEDYAASIDFPVSVRAIGEGSIAKFEEETDVLLLAPQVRYLFATHQEKFPNLKMATIDSRAYGLMDGEKVLNQARALVE